MDSLTQYFLKAVDSSTGMVSPYLNDDQLEQLNKLCGWLKQNDTTIIYSTLGAITLTTLYLFSGSNSSSKKSKKHRKSHKVKIKKEKVIPVDPIQQGKEIIAFVKKELNETYVPLVEQLEMDVEAENTSTEPREPVSYKQSTQYRKLFLNETLLALLLKLDGVTTELRTERKAAVKEIQMFLRRVDALKIKETR